MADIEKLFKKFVSEDITLSQKFLSVKLEEGKILDTRDNKSNLISHLDVNKWYGERTY